MPDGSAQESFHAKKWVGLIPTQGLQWKLCASICIQPLLFDGYLAPTEFPRYSTIIYRVMAKSGIACLSMWFTLVPSQLAKWQSISNASVLSFFASFLIMPGYCLPTGYGMGCPLLCRGHMWSVTTDVHHQPTTASLTPYTSIREAGQPFHELCGEFFKSGWARLSSYPFARILTAWN